MLPRQAKLRPVIARSHKLQSFFGLESDRYHEKRKLSIQHPDNHRGRSLDTDNIQKHKNTVLSQLTRKQEFARLYQKQKKEY